MVLLIVIPVLDDLIIKPFQNQQHLSVGHGVVLIGQKGLEIKYREVFLHIQGRRTVP